MKKILFVIGIIAIIGLGFFAISNISQKLKTDSQKITIVTTLFPLYDFAKNIGGDKTEVSLLLPPGVEAHTFEPKPSDIAKINSAKIFVYTGEFMEPWAHDIIESADKKVKIVDASTGIEMMKEEVGEHEQPAGGQPWEWSGAFDLEKGNYTWTFAKVDGEYADPQMKMAIISSDVRGIESIESAEKFAKKTFASNAARRQNTETLIPNANYELVFDATQEVTSYNIAIDKPGTYVFFTEHMPTEFEAVEHFFKNKERADVEPVAQEPEASGHHHHHHGGVDPHIWLDFDNARIMAGNIAKALSNVYPHNTEYYQNNLKAYLNSLTELDGDYKNTLSACKSKTIVQGGHYAFGYMVKRYNLEYVAAQGFSPDSEPTVKDMIALIEQIKKNNIGYVFYEELASPKIAETLTKETNTKLLLLNGAHNLDKKDYESGVSFISIMEENLKNLALGLGCKK